MAKRRAKGTGAVRQLRSGRWQAKILFEGRYIGAPVTFDTKLDAQAWLAKAVRDHDAGVFAPPVKTPKAAPVTVADYCDRWVAERTLKARTRQEYESLLKLHIRPTLGDELLTSLSPATIRSWHAGCAPGHPSTRSKAYSLLKSILSQAEDDELITRNPARIKGAGTGPKPKKKPLPTPEQIVKITALMPTDLQPAVILAAWGSLRISEVLGIRGEDIDLPRVHITQAASAVRGGAQIDTTKSDAGVRTIVIPPHVIPALKPLQGRTGLLWAAKSDPSRPMATSTFYRHWNPARDAVMPSLNFHLLRHFGGTTAAIAGATIGELMARLGHSSPSVAMIYQHASSERDAEVARRMSSL